MSEYDRLWREINGLRKNVRGLSQPQLAFSTVEDGYVTWRDADGNVRLRVGLQEDGTQSILHMNGPKPPTPSAPTVTVDGVVITVDHDGSNVGGEANPTDYRRRIVYAGFASDMSDAVPVATIEPPTGGQAVFMSPGNGTVYVAVRTETHATALSDFSTAVPVEVTMVSLEGELEIIKDSANGKNKNYYSPEPPKEGAEGDVWFDTSIDPDTGKPKWGLNLWDGSKWVTARDSRLQVVETAQAELAKKLDAVVVSADGGNKNFYSPTAPTKDMKTGDLWFDGSKGNMPHRFDGSKWVSVADERVQTVEKAQEALKADLKAVKATADGKNQAFYQPSTPTGSFVKGDLWFNTSEAGKNKISVWSGSAWVDVSDKRLADLRAGQDSLSGDLTGLRKSVDGKTTTRWEASVPTSATPGGVVGDTWHQYKDGKHVGTWRWDGSKWIPSVFDPVMIPLLDIGTGTFGELDGARIKADSVQAGKVLVKGSVGSTLIADGAITTSKIATGAITAESGVVGSLDAGTIKSGFLDSARIQAGSIRANQMQVSTDDNWVSTVLLANGITAPHRSLNGSTVEAITGNAYGPSLRVKRGSNNSSLAIRAPEGSSGSVQGGIMFPVQVGTRMVLRARLYRSGSYTNNVAPSVRSIAYHYKPDGSFLSQDNLPAWVKPMSYSGETTDILHHEWVIPQGAAWMQIYIQLDSDTGWVVLGDPVLKPMVGATVIEPGAITTDKIAAGAITAESGVIGSLDLGKATVGELDGSRIKANTVQADKVLVKGSVGSTVIADGAITTEKIATGAITAESGVIGSLDAGKITVGELDGARIKANTIGTDLLKAGAVTAKILDATAIDGKTITGATIRTGITGARVQLDSTGIHAYNPNSVETVTISAVTGEASMTGDLISGLPGTPNVRIQNALWSNAQWANWDGGTVYATGAGVRIGREDSYGSVGFAEISGSDGQVIDPDTEEATGNVSQMLPAIVMSGPGADTASTSSVSLYGNGSLLLRSKDGAPITLRSQTNRGDYVRLVGNGEVKIRSTGGAGLSLSKEGQVILKPGLGGKDSARLYMYDSAILQTRGGDSAILRTGNNRAALEVGAGGGEITMRADNVRVTKGALYYQRAPTTGQPANLHIDSNGWVAKSTSSRRYKHDIQDFAVPDALLDVPFRTWIDKGEYERNGHSAEGLTRIPGLIAEEVEKACPALVVHDDQGRPDALHGDRIGMAALTLIRRQRDRITRLEEKITHMEGAK